MMGEIYLPKIERKGGALTFGPIFLLNAFQHIPKILPAFAKPQA
jgi:hypothetical protein